MWEAGPEAARSALTIEPAGATVLLLDKELRSGPLETNVRREGQCNSFSLSPKFEDPLFWQSPAKVHFLLHKVDVQSSWDFLPQLAFLHSHSLSNEGGIKSILVFALYSFLQLLRTELIAFVQLPWRALVSETVPVWGQWPTYRVLFPCMSSPGIYFLWGCSIWHYLGCKYNVLLQSTMIRQMPLSGNLPCHKWMELCCPEYWANVKWEDGGSLQGSDSMKCEVWTCLHPQICPTFSWGFELTS